MLITFGWYVTIQDQEMDGDRNRAKLLLTQIRRSARELLLYTGGTASPLPSAATKHDASYIKDEDLEVMVRASQEILCNLESMAATRRRRGSRQEKHAAAKIAEEGAHARGQHHSGRSNFVQSDKKVKS
jgi:hypothetical protein